MASFDKVWERVHSEKEWGKYPKEELVRFIMSKYKHLSITERINIKILELGLGQGANMWFLAREGFDVYGIEGSESAVRKAKKRFEEENLKADFKVGDFNNLEGYAKNGFDIVVDIVSLQHNSFENIKNILKQCCEKLKPGGRIFSIMVSRGSVGDGMGEQLEEGTFTNIPSGPFKDVGVVHFFEESEVDELFKIFKNITIDYEIRSIDNGKNKIKHWIITGEK